MTVNGAPLQQKTRIMSGDAIQAGQLLIRYYVVMPPARQSWQSKMLTILSRLSLALLFVLQLLFMFWLPWRLSDSRLWEGSVAKQKITRAMDDMVRRRGEYDGAAIADQIRERFSPPAVAARLTEIYESLI